MSLERRTTRLNRAEAALIALGSIGLVLCWGQRHGLAMQAESLGESIARTRQMQTDAAEIDVLRKAPQLATERVRANDELIAQIEAAMKAAAIDAKHWIANEPIAPVRLPKSAYRQFAIRLAFDDVSLRQIVELAHALLDKDPSLSILRMRLSGPPSDTQEKWACEMALAYLVYSPQ